MDMEGVISKRLQSVEIFKKIILNTTLDAGGTFIYQIIENLQIYKRLSKGPVCLNLVEYRLSDPLLRLSMHAFTCSTGSLIAYN